MKLCEHAKMSDEGRIMIERYFGRISEADAQAAIAAAAADRAELEKLAEEGTPA
jgi:lipoprotein NlpI